MVTRAQLVGGGLAALALSLAGGVSAQGGKAAAASAPTARPGRRVRMPGMTSTRIAARDVIVWLPDGYDASATRYAVLYMHDGRNLFDPATAYGGQTWSPDLVLTQLGGAVRPTIVVGVDNTPARYREYMPAGVFNALADTDRAVLEADMKGAPVSDAYLAFLVRELKPLIDARFRTLSDRDNTFVMGSSMGGLISLAALADYPAVFGGAGCLSTHWPLPAFGADGPKLSQAAVCAAFDGYLKAELGKPASRRLWFDHGDQTLDRFYAPYQDHIDRTVADLGWVRGRDFESRTYPGAAHNEASWRARLADPLRFLLAK